MKINKIIRKDKLQVKIRTKMNIKLSNFKILRDKVLIYIRVICLFQINQDLN